MRPMVEVQGRQPTAGGRSIRLADGVYAAVTDRLGGFSARPYNTRNLGGRVGDDPAAVRQNRDMTAAELGLAPDRVVFMRQVHGATVHHVTEPFGDGAPDGVEGG